MPERVGAVGLQCAFVPAVEESDLDDLLPDDWREAIRRYRTDPVGVLAEDELRMQQRAARWASDPRGLYAELFSTGDDSELYERSRTHWMPILAATDGTWSRGTPALHRQIERDRVSQFRVNASRKAVHLRAVR